MTPENKSKVYRRAMNHKIAEKYLVASKVNLDANSASDKSREREFGLLHTHKWSVLNFVDADELADVMDRLMST